MKKEEGNSGRNDSGIVSVIFGILSIINVGLVGSVIGVVGLVFGIVQNKKHKNLWSQWGIILSIIGIVVGVIVSYFIYQIVFQNFSQFPAEGLPADLNLGQ
ncbi:MAG: hypothetical protein Q8P57_01720 [Candidatus Pacearchaeota archaeon]|nr:hypothetical protein [Candidatus Pacearchaeota archaeon]